ncbi:hypothetical protein niasHS_000793 [Heterodera schachtii]|uniref:Uncharacterized protein n=1 Tax=Heterodera schachtii TaxID=97005 RepID=A0ABD2K8E2_HETSC
MTPIKLEQSDQHQQQQQRQQQGQQQLHHVQLGLISNNNNSSNNKLFSPPLLLMNSSDQQQQQEQQQQLSPSAAADQQPWVRRHNCQTVPLATVSQQQWHGMPTAPVLLPAIAPADNAISAEPTMENFFRFVQLANTFGFQFDLDQKLLRWNSSTVPTMVPEEEEEEAEMDAKTAQCQQHQHQQQQQPMEMETDEPTLITWTDQQQQEQQKRQQQRRKASNTSSSGHLTVPSTSRRSSSASTVKAHLSSPTVSPVHSNGPAEYTSSADQFFPLLAQLGPAQRLTSAVVRDYLSNPARYDCVLWMYHAKVAQKSYGTEKRFFCPPPCIYLMGEGWRTRRKLLEQLYRHHHHQNSYKSSPNASGDPSLANIDEREKFVELCASIVVGAESATTAADDKKQNEQTKQHHLLDFSNGKDYSAAKALHISDTDKRKYFHLNAHFGYACGALELGTFASQRIKVISKPSKKKQSMKSSDCKYLCVGNKSKIALFNRLRSQTVSTRYLHVDEKISTNQKMHEPPAFVASSTKWGAFHINVVDQPEFGGQQSQQQQQQHTVTYGSVIQLVDSQTEMRLPLMRIRKVDKQHVLLDPAGQGEPVSQLHKCAFQMVDVASNGAELFYLCLSQDKIIQFQAIQVDAHRHQISDGAAWTIISTDKAEYRWAEPLAANGSISPKQITPVPQLHSLNMLDASQKLMQVDNCRMTGSATIELNGTNFTSQLRVWFGATPAETIYCTKERLSCAVPSLYTVCKHLGCTVAEAVAAHAGSGGKLLVPLLLARDEDGILYPTPHTFPYQLQTPAVQSESSAAAMNGGVGTAKICAADSSALAKNGGTLCSLEETIPERFFTENRANGIGEAQQLLMMHNAN